MKLNELPLSLLAPWAKLNNISLHGVRIDSIQSRGFGVVADQAIEESPNAALILVPRDLVLSAENVREYAKMDSYLRELLEGAEALAATSRGIILIYLIYQVARISVPSLQNVGVSSPWTQYHQFLRPTILPTMWSQADQMLLAGTSLEIALEAKLQSLQKEIDSLKAGTEHLQWCRDYWWNDACYEAVFSVWLHLDSWYRSRGFQLPGHRNAALVPILDMINHEEGTATNARYAENDDGDVCLLLKPGKSIPCGSELLISYGDEKSVAEMLFSYGFTEDCIENTSNIIIEMTVPDDDPLKKAKLFLSDTSTVKLYRAGKTTSWESSFLWLVCVNQEDGLDFRVLQRTDGGRELKAFWKGDELENIELLPDKIRTDKLYDVFHLRAICLLQEHIRDQIGRLNVSDSRAAKLGSRVDSAFQQSFRLRSLEMKLLADGDRDLEEQ